MSEENKVQKPQVPKVDTKFVAKQYAIGYGSQWLSSAIVTIPVIILWVILYFAMIGSGWILTLSSNVRGILIFAVLVIPLIAAAVIRPKIRDYLSEKWNK